MWLQDNGNGMNSIELKDIDEYFGNKNFMPLLPLLEKPYSEVRHIDDAKLLAIVEYALEWETKDYWQSLSIGWIEDGLPIKQSTLQMMEAIPNDKGYTQKLRHRVIKLLKQKES